MRRLALPCGPVLPKAITATSPHPSLVPPHLLLSAQVTKAMNVSVVRTASGLPWLRFKDRASYTKSKTDQYDAGERFACRGRAEAGRPTHREKAMPVAPCGLPLCAAPW